MSCNILALVESVFPPNFVFHFKIYKTKLALGSPQIGFTAVLCYVERRPTTSLLTQIHDQYVSPAPICSDGEIGTAPMCIGAVILIHSDISFMSKCGDLGVVTLSVGVVTLCIGVVTLCVGVVILMRRSSI